MNKTISINIKGFVFNIEEDAYNLLEIYLNKLKSIFKGQEGAGEILDDVESRIAELFAEKLGNTYQAITQADVEEAIGVLGEPEDYQTEDDEEESRSTSNSTQAESANKKLYRDQEDGMIGGVCLGIAHFLGWEVIWVRILFILFAFSGFSIILYIILYLIVPEAITTGEKLHMKGEPINIENIKRKVSEGFEDTKDAFKKAGKEVKEGKSGIGRLIKKLLDLIGSIFSLIGKFIYKFYGLILLLLGLFLLFGSITAIVTADTFFFGETHMTLSDFDDIFVHGNGMMTMAIIGLGLIVFSLLFSFLFNGIRILFNLYGKVKGLGLLTIGLVILGGILISVGIMNNVKHQAFEERVSTFISGDSLQGDTLYVDLFEDLYFNENIRVNNSMPFDLIKKSKDKVVLGYPIELKVHNSAKDYFEVEIERESHGGSVSEAFDNLDEFEFEYSWQGSRLTLSPNILINEKSKFHDQSVEVHVYVPDGKVVHLCDNIGRIENPGWRNNLGGKTLGFIDGELEKMD